MRLKETNKFDVDLFERFRITKEFGFLEVSPLQKLSPEFQPWIDACAKIPEWIKNGTIRENLHELPEISTDSLKSHEEFRFAHLLLCTMETAFVWGFGEERATSILPRQLAVPLYEVSKRLDVPPVVAHLTGCLANWRKIDGNGPWEPENLELIAFNFSELRGEHWFFVLTAQIEKDFAAAIHKIAEICLKVEKLEVINEEELVSTLRQMRISIREATNTLKRMPEHLKPSDFFYKVRPFLWGYNEGSIKETGIIFEGLEHLGALKCNGGSAAQSSAMHIFDEFLGIEHQGKSKEFLLEQRLSMPVPHRNLIKWVSEFTPLKQMKHLDEYREVIETVKNFRSGHIRTVSWGEGL
ncbi:unnamed protein product, partial [Mesorhabditis belari]|uniref:Indoleamine 2,3-dioxygenase n=1 Tax=Mesorhabditis belari TaxID=2138241 RepID=A0AAF3EJ20_9BILA